MASEEGLGRRAVLSFLGDKELGARTIYKKGRLQLCDCSAESNTENGRRREGRTLVRKREKEEERKKGRSMWYLAQQRQRTVGGNAVWRRAGTGTRVKAGSEKKKKKGGGEREG